MHIETGNSFYYPPAVGQECSITQRSVVCAEIHTGISLVLGIMLHLKLCCLLCSDLEGGEFQKNSYEVKYLFFHSEY